MEEQQQPESETSRLAVDIPAMTFKRAKAAAAILGLDLKVFVAETLDDRSDAILKKAGSCAS